MHLSHHHKLDGSFYPVEDCPIYRASKNGIGCRVDKEVMWHQNGTPLPVEYSSFPIFEDGKITGAVVTISDITERKRAEEKLRESETIFRSIFDNAQIGISLYRLDGVQYFTNRALHKMVGYSHEELSSLEKWDQIVHPDERASRAERYKDLLEGKRDNDWWEQRFLHRDGRVVSTRRNCSILKDSAGKPQFVLNMTEDITEHKQAQEERNLIAKQMEMLLESTGKAFTESISRETAPSSTGLVQN